MWVFFSILGPLFWSISNIIDKYVLTKWVKKPLVPIVVTSIICLAVGLIIYSTVGFLYLSYLNVFLAILTGIITILIYVLYFKALQIQEASRVIPLFYLSPLFILILAAVFLNEVFTPLKYLGIFLVIGGTILISVKNFSKISFGKAFWWMILAAGLDAINAVLTKHLLNLADFWTIFGYKNIGMFIGSIPITYFYLDELIRTVKQYGKKVVIAISASETITLIGTLFFTIAMFIGYVTLTRTLSSIQPFFVLLFTLLLSIFYPLILKEELGKLVISQKILAIILMFIGVILIT